MSLYYKWPYIVRRCSEPFTREYLTKVLDWVTVLDHLSLLNGILHLAEVKPATEIQ